MKSVSVVFTNRTYKWEVQKPKPRNPSVWNRGGIELFTPNLVLLIVENGGDPLSRRFPWLGVLNCSLTERVDNWTLLGDKGSWLPTQMIFVFTIGLSIISTERRVGQCTRRIKAPEPLESLPSPPSQGLAGIPPQCFCRAQPSLGSSCRSLERPRTGSPSWPWSWPRR